MANSTKKALEASLKKLLKEKPFDKITIADLTGDCGISRMTFYYHFQDIYELAEWVCIEDGKQALKDKKTYDTWQEGMIQVLLQQFVQLLLLLQQRRVQIRQAAARRFFGLRLFRLRLHAAELQFAARAEHAVHQAFPIIGVCHGAALHRCFFFQYSELRGILQAQKSSPFRGS